MFWTLIFITSHSRSERTENSTNCANPLRNDLLGAIILLQHKNRASINENYDIFKIPLLSSDSQSEHRLDTDFTARMLSEIVPPGGWMVEQLVERSFDCSLSIKANIVFKQVITFHYENGCEKREMNESFTYAGDFIERRGEARNFPAKSRDRSA